MKHTLRMAFYLGVAALATAPSFAGNPGETDFSASPYAKLRSVGMEDARWDTRVLGGAGPTG